MAEEVRAREELVREIEFLRGRLKELEVSEQRYREIVQNANSVILRMDTGGRITFFNAYAQRFFGYYENEILGENAIGTIVPETDETGADLKAMIKDIVENPQRHSTNVNENMRANGQRIWMAWTNKAIIDDDGRISEILCIGNDITKLKQQMDDYLAKNRKTPPQ
jgi:PAS domain S-box-containing protein